jgi:hypothetical protein
MPSRGFTARLASLPALKDRAKLTLPLRGAPDSRQTVKLSDIQLLPKNNIEHERRQQNDGA